MAIGRLACRMWTEPWSGSRARWIGYKKCEVREKETSYCELMHSSLPLLSTTAENMC
jgi:hypothetical protein